MLKLIKKHNNGEKLVYKLSDIPTKNKVIVIDNYSKMYNYIIEGDKIYYSRKNHDYWVDISDNDLARKNLFNFIKSNYDFKGYQDNEKDIYDLIKNNKFNYNDYTKNIKDNKTKQESKEVAKTEPVINHKLQKKLLNSTDPYMQEFINMFGTNNTDATQLYRKELIPKVKADSSVITYDPDDTWNLDSWIEKGKNYISRQFGKLFEAEEDYAKLSLPYPNNVESEYAIRPGSFTGDTIKLFQKAVPGDRRYILPENIDVNSYTFGHRNRGELKDIESEGVIITSFSPFLPYGKHRQNAKTYIGVDKDGKLIAGDISNFEEGSFLAPTYSNIIKEFKKDKDGNIIYTESKKNRGKLQPVAVLIDEKTGEIIDNPNNQVINLLSNKGKNKGTYGNITGGRFLVRVGDELRLLSGSPENIDYAFEEMKHRNNQDRGIFYTLDNGSYNIALRTVDKKLTPNDWKQYDQRNSGGGNVLYLDKSIQHKDMFRSDTIWTPNVRTEQDESYKKGHPLINELQGVVLHHTAFEDDNLTPVINHLTNPKSQASAHVVIGYDGTRKILARPEQVTFHAGASVWNNRDNVNDFMIGIEFQGNTDKKDLTNEQILSAVEYLEPIIRKYNISLENIVTHKQVRDLYNDFARKAGEKQAPGKIDINQKNYERILNELLKKVYYKK